MKFKIDENLPTEAALLMKENGHDALTIMEQNLSGSSDSNIAEICRKEKRVLITLDTDFADIRMYPPNNFFGIVVLRLKKQDKKHVISILNRLSKILPKEPLVHHLWIVEEGRIRISGENSASNTRIP